MLINLINMSKSGKLPKTTTSTNATIGGWKIASLMGRSGKLPRTYAGIGARKTPAGVLFVMQQLGQSFAEKGWVLNSGGADGADKAFERGALLRGGRVNIFLPWPNFQGSKSKFAEPSKEAFSLAQEVHPSWDYLSAAARRLHARNIHQVLGLSLKDPVEFVVCWTPDGAQIAEECGKITGGTATAIRIATKFSVPVHNLKTLAGYRECHQFLKVLKST